MPVPYERLLPRQTHLLSARRLALAALLLSATLVGLARAKEQVDGANSAVLLAEALPQSGPTQAERDTSPFVPAWAAEAVFYQIFPERFDNGDPTNDPTRESLERGARVPTSWQPTAWTQDWYRRDAWEQARGDWFYDGSVYDRRYGGDLQGVLNRLDYLQDLGVNTIYLNPVFYACSSHKYDGNSFHHVDPYFGPDPAGDLKIIQQETLDPATWQWTAADRLFLKLVAEVHRRDMRIILDGVFNHTGRNFPAFHDLVEKQADSPYKDWYVVKSYDDPATPDDEFDYQGWWGSRALPEFADNEAGDDLHPKPKQYVLAITRRWMDPNGDGDPADGIDGWRLDVAPEVPLGFWKQWNAYAREINPDAFTVGEYWDDASSMVEQGCFSSTMNYSGFAYPVKGFLIDGTLTASDFTRELDRQREAYSPPCAYALQNLIDSHDTPRVGSMVVNAGLRPNVRPERADYDVNEGSSPRWSERVSVAKPSADERQLQRLVALFQMVYVGPPMIYYGTEAGMWGCDDPCNRMPMIWPEKQYEPQAGDPRGRERTADPVEFDPELHAFYRSACRMRRDTPTLHRGNLETVLADNEAQVIVLRRWDDQRSIYAVFNRGKEPYVWLLDNPEYKPLTTVLTASGMDHDVVVSRVDGKVTVSVPPREGVVLVQEQ